ncbi:alpha/beta fold hydrolase [Streptacidiphilus carbonis]|uniref:alpha/beta fold hydrolase n=1 Tax=Streptacidiphilus carbonis TaxID=105422 RepID=UPI001F319B4C|nr:alpha/beta hydrolase [Streptacidiphilus carbonis]
MSEWGKRDGFPVFVLHGTPGSRVGVAPRPTLLYQLGIRLIGYDRPGYGQSGRSEGRAVGDAARDVEAIADRLGLDSFAVVGRSGGGPHALACAALLPERVTRAAAMVSLAPQVGPLSMGASWTEGMGPGNIDAFARAAEGAESITEEVTARSSSIRADPDILIRQLAEGPHADQRVIADAGIRQVLRRNYQEAFLSSGDGWIDDLIAFSRDWGFSVSDITVPVLLWHGRDDVFSPAQHSAWLARHIRGTDLRLEYGKAHLDAMSVLPDLLPWLRQRGTTGQRRSTRQPGTAPFRLRRLP